MSLSRSRLLAIVIVIGVAIGGGLFFLRSGPDMGIDADPCHPDIGSEKPNMPNLEALCEKGVVFDNVWVNPVCSPTRATMLSGQYGFRTGVLDVDNVLSPAVESVADVLTSKVPLPYAN